MAVDADSFAQICDSLEMICEARLVGGGRKLATVACRAFSADGETVFATGQGVFRRLQ